MQLGKSMWKGILTESCVEVTLMDGETKTTTCLPITHFRVQKRNTELRLIFASASYKGGRQDMHPQKDSWVSHIHVLVLPWGCSTCNFFLKPFARMHKTCTSLHLSIRVTAKREDLVRMWKEAGNLSLNLSPEQTPVSPSYSRAALLRDTKICKFSF